MTRTALTLVLAIALAAFTVPARAQDTVNQGKRYFMSNGCYGCHTVGTMGTPIGPDLCKVGAKYSRP